MSKVLGEDNVQELEDILAEEEPEVIPPGEEEGKEKKDEEGETKKGKEDEEGQEEKIDESKELSTGFNVITVGDINKKYPEFFKDFPDLRHTFFQAREYREIFPSVEDAKEALEDVEGLKELESAILSGETEDIEGVLDSIKELGDEALPNLAINFLPALRKADQDTYFSIITPIIVDTIRNAFDSGNKNSNENLQNAALVISHFLFGDQKVATGEREVKTKEPIKKEVKDDSLDRERREFRQERYTSFYNDVASESGTKLERLVANGLDPKNTLTEGQRDIIIEKTVKEIEKTLSSNKSHSAKMNSLWKKAGETNFVSSNKSKILSAYLEAAGEIMPRIRSNIRSTILGTTRERHLENSVGRKSNEDRREPKNNAGGGSRQSSGAKEVKSAKDVNWKKTSDLDFLRDNITLKD